MNDYDFSGAGDFTDYGGDYGDYGSYDYGGYDYDYGSMAPTYEDFAGPGAGDYGEYGGWGEGDFDMGYGDYAEPDYGGEWGQGSLNMGYEGVPEGYSEYGSPDAGQYWDQGVGLGASTDEGLMSVLAGLPAAAKAAFMTKLKNNPIGTLSGLAGAGINLYGDYRYKKAQEEQARKIAEAREAREARMAKFNAPINYRMDRQVLPPPADLLTAGQRSGGINWFSPTTFTQMADGGAVEPSWWDRLLSRKPTPATVGSGTAAGAANAAMRQQYQRYAVGEQMEDRSPMPYEQWVQSRGRAKGGLSGLDGGQDDTIPIQAAPGEYVMDADVVAGLGDGNNAAGAKKLDELRRRVREHKRRAPSSKIPPKAKSIEKYMKKKGD